MNINATDDILEIAFIDRSKRQSIMAAITTRDMAKLLTRVKSSNVWAYTINVKDNQGLIGDVLAQFKNKNGGPGDIYIYYDVPTSIFRKWTRTSSKGHYFWQHIRNKYKYAKLTGDKKTKLPNGI